MSSFFPDAYTGVLDMSFQVPVTILLLNKWVRIEQTCLLSPNIVQITSREYGWAMTCWSSFVWGFKSSYQGKKKCTTHHNNMKQVVLTVLWVLTSLKSQHFVKRKEKEEKKEEQCQLSLFSSTQQVKEFFKLVAYYICSVHSVEQKFAKFLSTYRQFCTFFFMNTSIRVW